MDGQARQLDRAPAPAGFSLSFWVDQIKSLGSRPLGGNFFVPLGCKPHGPRTFFFFFFFLIPYPAILQPDCFSFIISNYPEFNIYIALLLPQLPLLAQLAPMQPCFFFLPSFYISASIYPSYPTLLAALCFSFLPPLVFVFFVIDVDLLA